MKGPLIVSLLALALGGVALVTVLTGPRPTDSRAVEPVLPAAPSAELLARLEELSEENRDLRERLALLESRPAPAQRATVTADFASREELEALRGEVRAALAGRAPAPREVPLASPEFKEQVADTLSAIRHEEAVEKVRTYQERRLERLDETMPKVEEWLELTPYQSNEMRSALLVQYERETELVRRWEAGEDPEVLGEVKASDREAHLRELAAFLTPEQLETYAARAGGGGK